MGYDGMMVYGTGGYFWGALMLVFWLLTLIALILTVIWLFQHIKGQSALEILQQRYARGELSKKQYEEMRKDLR